ncbi:unnamed protein product [Polarella glacialis]|uniref:Uncharacterized protein n=1 Tax=Polarella glacialis TaxID=89957 RepID=A0A813JTW8_POLGL|nr:unnamed protein product [Polarella glacialis]CAE8689262.1 unnamed protein product [Polarella glacialis]
MPRARTEIMLPNLPGVKMESPFRGGCKTVRLNLSPAIRRFSGNDPMHETGPEAMPELDFAALVPNMPGMLMESPCRGRGKNTVRFNLVPEIHTISRHDPSPDVGVARKVSEPFDPPGHVFLQKEIDPDPCSAQSS